MFYVPYALWHVIVVLVDVVMSYHHSQHQGGS